ncbi:hypothetical protein NPIL_171671 [Nephila pilipes]|uniref:Uncharacterized protein n=1 Tax=Nephila pilipes TaxID=299642 RepID=A0A8X6MXG2_NEPPI|nr:hypothetical protein NPIL_171671 [Nephila pilipes]
MEEPANVLCSNKRTETFQSPLDIKIILPQILSVTYNFRHSKVNEGREEQHVPISTPSVSRELLKSRILEDSLPKTMGELFVPIYDKRLVHLGH